MEEPYHAELILTAMASHRCSAAQLLAIHKALRPTFTIHLRLRWPPNHRLSPHQGHLRLNGLHLSNIGPSNSNGRRNRPHLHLLGKERGNGYGPQPPLRPRQSSSGRRVLPISSSSGGLPLRHHRRSRSLRPMRNLRPSKSSYTDPPPRLSPSQSRLPIPMRTHPLCSPHRIPPQRQHN